MQISVSREPPHSSAQVPQAAAPKPKLLDEPESKGGITWTNRSLEKQLLLRCVKPG